MRIPALLAVACLLAAPALADWPHTMKWMQSEATDTYGAASWIDNDTPSYPLSADDFLCDNADLPWISDIEFWGWSQYGDDLYIEQFEVQFWSDMPATPDDESHPDQPLYSYVVDPADPGDPLGIGWQYLGDNHFKINLPQDQWFYQEGSAENPVVYWLSIRGVMVDDGVADAFYWAFKDRYLPTWGDDAAFWSDYFGYPPWANWGWPIRDDGSGDPYAAAPDLYEGPFPTNWEASADLAFNLTAIPEPATMLLVGLGLALLRRR